MYTYMYIETRETRERETLPLSSSFNILSCNLFSHLDSFLSFARFEVSRTRARRKTASVVHIFLFPRASQGIVVGHTWRVRDTKRDGAYFVRDKKKKVFAHYYVYIHHQPVSRTSNCHFSKIFFSKSLYSGRENNSPKRHRFITAETGTKHIAKNTDSNTGNDRRSARNKRMLKFSRKGFVFFA